MAENIIDNNETIPASEEISTFEGISAEVKPSRADTSSYAQEAYEIVQHAEKNIGSRLPGSENERKFHKFMADKLSKIGANPVTEEFAVSPRSGIGGLPYAGWMGIILSALVYFALANEALWIGMGAVAAITLAWLILSVFLYKRWFDRFFHQEISQNTYGVLTPQDGEYDYTIIMSGHTDTSWNWKHSEFGSKWRDNPIKGIVWTYAKVGFGAVTTIGMYLLCIFMCVVYTAKLFDKGVDVDAASQLLAGFLGESVSAVPHNWAYNLVNSDGFAVFLNVLRYIPICTALGGAFIAMWNDKNPQNASKGAMDNATGIAISYEVMKYFHDHPEQMPPRCRIIDLNCGSEEAGLRGSMAFADRHKGDELTQNAWNINIDSIADKEYFEVVIKDDWQFTRFDKDLEKMFKDTFAEMQIESKTNGCIHNPVGGCDSTPMTKAGVKSVTFAAQNPVLTYYYHTFHDKSDRFEVSTVQTGLDVCLSVIDKISQFQQENGYNGVNH